MMIKTSPQEILEAGKARGRANQLPYAGAVIPQEAFALMESQAAVLIDVRTKEELDFVGYIPNAHHLQWASYPAMQALPTHFAETFFHLAAAKGWQFEQPLLFICRTGGRSHQAALVAQHLGFTMAFNVLEGFEGEANAQKQRTLKNGWRFAGLPWANR